MLHKETIEPGALDVLTRLMALVVLDEFILVGGTALALQIGHRRSDDLDLFCRNDFEAENLLEAIRGVFTDVMVHEVHKNTLNLAISGVKTDLIRYAYPELESVRTIDGVRMMSIPDIAAMKLSAVANRGARKDFYDVWFLAKQHGLSRLLEWYRAKFVDFEAFPVIKSLCFFDDAEMEPDPVLLKPVSWESVKQWLRAEVGKL